MGMTYRLFDTQRGIVIDRTPCVAEDEFAIAFLGVPDGARVVFRVAELSFVREIRDGGCIAPVGKMCGTVSVCVSAVCEGSIRRWTCEGLLITLLGDGSVLVRPDDADLAARYAEILSENQDLRDNLKRVEEDLEKLSRRLQDMADGWDIE